MDTGGKGCFFIPNSFCKLVFVCTRGHVSHGILSHKADQRQTLRNISLKPPPPPLPKRGMRSSGSACRWKHQTGIYSYWMMLCHMKVITNLTFIIQSPVNAKVNKLEGFFFSFTEKHKPEFTFIPNSCIYCNLIQSCDLTLMFTTFLYIIDLHRVAAQEA